MEGVATEAGVATEGAVATEVRVRCCRVRAVCGVAGAMCKKPY